MNNGEGRRHRVRIGEEDSAERGDRREQDDAEARVGDEHQETKRRQRNQKIHEAPSPIRDPTLRIFDQSAAPMDARQARLSSQSQ
jgi:hypothetical protein